MKKIFIILAMISFLIPLSVSAALFEKGQSYNLAKDQSVSVNLYTVGGNVTVLGNVKEDLMAAGGTIILTGLVGKDAGLAGGTIDISGNIGEDLRVAGGNIMIGGKVGGELLALGGQLTVAPGVEIKGESYLIGGNIVIDGNLGKNLVIRGGTVAINGTIEGSVKITASNSVTISSGAVIKGNLDYSSPKPATIQDGAKIQGVTNYKKIEPAKTYAKFGGRALFGAAWLIKFLMILVAALVVSLLLKKQTQTAVRYIMPNFGKELLRGFIILVVLPVAIVISFITVVGVILGVAGLLFYGLMLVFGMILAQIVVGAMVSKLIFKQENYEGNWKSALIGAIALALVCLIPYIGSAICFVFFLASFGALFNFLYKHFQSA